jgi:hypothetical protein
LGFEGVYTRDIINIGCRLFWFLLQIGGS